MELRYGELNFWFGFISRETERLNHRLYELLMRPVRREATEPVGKHELDSVPEWHERTISPMGTLPGYALPRIFVEQIGNHKAVSRDELQNRLLKGLDVLEEAIPKAATPTELLALVAEGLLKADCSVEDIMKHTFSKGWVEEHNAHRMMAQFKLMTHYTAPELSAAYSALTQTEKAQLGLV